jgi:hypothetical protein
VDRVLALKTGGLKINSWEQPFLHIAIKPRNIPKYIANNLLRNISFHITTGHLHYRVYLGISADFYDSVEPLRITLESWRLTLKAHLGTVEAHLRGVKAHPGDVKSYLGGVKTHLAGVDTHLGSLRLTLES